MTLSPANTAFKNTDVTGLGYAKDFALIDHNGTPVHRCGSCRLSL